MGKPPSTAPYCFVSGQTDKPHTPTTSNYVLSIRQQPLQAKVCGAKERDRRPIDPPPIVQIKLADPATDRNKDYLQSPYLFMCCNLVHFNDPTGDIVAPAHRALAGTVVSSLNRLKDIDNSDGGFFVFGDMSVRVEGRFCLRFTLFELKEDQVVHVLSTMSEPMTVHSSKTFPGMSESTFLSRCFSDQGVRIRIRKDHHVKPKRHLSMDAEDVAQGSIHSSPSSCHEADQSDSDSVKKPLPAKRAKSSLIHGDNPLVSLVLQHKQSHRRSTSAEVMERTPPGMPVGQDPAPSRSHHHPLMSMSSTRRHDDHYGSSSSLLRPSDLYISGRPLPPYDEYDHVARITCQQIQGSSHYQSSDAEDIPQSSSPSYYSNRYDRTGPHSLVHSTPPNIAASSFTASSDHPYPHPCDRGRSYAEKYSSSYDGHRLLHSRGATHSFSYPEHPATYARLPPPPGSSVKLRNAASCHGFPAALLNEQNLEYTPGPGVQDDIYHSRTPSMSSQYSDSKFSPPRPFSPSESHPVPDQEVAPPAPRLVTLPAFDLEHHIPTVPPSGVATAMVTRFLSRSVPLTSSSHWDSGAGTAIKSGATAVRLQLPPIHTLSTRSPTLAGPAMTDTLPSTKYFVHP